MRRRPTFRSTLTSLLALFGAVAVLVLIVNAIAFQNARSLLPVGTKLSGVDIGGLTVDNAISHTITAFANPLTLRYQNNSVTLTPAQIDFRLDEDATAAQLDAIVVQSSSWSNLPAFVLRRAVSPTLLSAPYLYSPERLDDFMLNVAQQYDRPPQQVSPDLSAKQVAQPQPGYALNLSEARRLVLAALTSATQREVQLPVDEIPFETTNVRTLEAAVRERLKSFLATEGSVAAVFIKDLKTGDELRINDQLPFSAEGWLRMALVAEAFRLIQDTPPQAVAQQLDAILLQGDRSSAKNLLTTLGQGDAQAGIDHLNDTLKRMGLRSTFLAQPFGQDGLASTFVTPANGLPEAAQLKPDARAQSTLAEMAALLETIEQCRNGVGSLPLAFPGAFTPIKCAQIMDLLSRNKINALIEAGSPGASVAHRQSWDANNHGDAAVVRTPGGTYIIAIMLHRPDGLQWSETSVIIADIARLTFALFNNQIPPAVAGINAPPAP